jgi:hypothetical protein
VVVVSSFVKQSILWLFTYFLLCWSGITGKSPGSRIEKDEMKRPRTGLPRIRGLFRGQRSFVGALSGDEFAGYVLIVLLWRRLGGRLVVKHIDSANREEMNQQRGRRYTHHRHTHKRTTHHTKHTHVRCRLQRRRRRRRRKKKGEEEERRKKKEEERTRTRRRRKEEEEKTCHTRLASLFY